MTETNSPVRDPRGEIVQPLTKWNFRARFRNSEVFTKSIESVQVDYAFRNIDLTLRETPKREVIDLFLPIDFDTDELIVETLDRTNDSVISTHTFSGLRMVSCPVGFDYLSSAPVTLTPRFSYVDVDRSRPEAPE